MKKSIAVICLSSLLIGWIANSAYPYPINVSCFFEGLALETGEKAQDPTILVVIFGEPDEIEQVLQPLTEIVDFSMYPDVDLYFKYAPEMTNPIQIIAEYSMQYAVVDAMFDFEHPTSFAFQKLTVGELIEINPTDILVLQTDLFETFIMKFAYFSNLDLKLDLESFNKNAPIPEPASLGLLGLGLIGLIGYLVIRKRKREHVIKGMILLLSFMMITGASKSVFGQQEGTFTMRKAGDGTGTIIIGEQTCDSECLELTVPYTPKTAIILKAIPDADSVFVGWEKEDATSVAGKLYAQPDDLVFAVFDKTTQPQQPPTTHISFGTVVSDETIIQLLERHNITPNAVSLWISGLKGTHRAYETLSAKAFVEEVRMNTIAMLEKAVEGNFIRIEEFVELYNENDVIQSEELQEQVRSFLNLREAIINALDAARQGEALIFAFEVNQAVEQLEDLSKEDIVKAISSRDDEMSIESTIIPQLYQEEFLDATIQSMTPQQLYQRARVLIYGAL